MSIVFSLIAVVAYLIVIVRVVTYRKHGARYRPHVSWIAWILVAVMGGAVIDAVIHAQSVGLFEAGCAVLLAFFVSRVRGNIACLLENR
ncbi:phage holin family protein [Paraburkholderia hayleyella]|uniref:phage holin family protein n=1 Tax=Paraburkholderia hayleyella TaxID=2152889 RepID=UPI0012923B4D|nr:phage holin family protein [Paraburkholderia hayleyella]